MLLIGFGLREKLHMLAIGFGVDKLLDPPDLQVPVVVGNDVCREYRFVGLIGPVFGRRLVCELCGRYHVNKQTRCQSQRSGYRRG